MLLTGGGTAGHITPILAVAHELKQLQPDSEVIYVGERRSKFGQLTDGHTAIDSVYSVFSGKLRRYHRESWLERLTDLNTIFLNIRDILFVLIGIVQAWRLLAKLKPDAVFLKGGYVGVPVGLAAAAHHIPIVTHDSDALRGLANRLVTRWVNVHATALPAKYYPYPPQKVKHVGVLVEHDYQPVDADMQAKYKTQLGLPADKPLLLITGGSLGAEQINKTVASFVGELLAKRPNLRIIHQVGQGKKNVYSDYSHERLQITEFMKPMYVNTGAADLIVTRAGANAMAEFGVQQKACIVVPSPHLTGGHQLKNAELLKEQGSALVIQEDDLLDKAGGLMPAIERLLDNEVIRKQLAVQLSQSTLPHAAKELAQILIDQVKNKT